MEKAGRWKEMTFFPYHCSGCLFAGYPDDFYIICGNTFVCLDCKNKYQKFINKVLKKKNIKINLNK